MAIVWQYESMEPLNHGTMLSFFTSLTGIDVRFLHKGDNLKAPTNCARLNQVHSNRTISVQHPMDATEKADLSAEALAKADGMITDTIGLPLVIRVADCQSFCIYAPKKRVIGALHAGWRGLVADAIEEHFNVLKREWDIEPKDVWIAAGPSLCQRCAEFTDPKKELPGIDPRFFDGRYVDLRGIADEKFRTLGVVPERIERHPDCTRCHPERYWSYRGGDRSAVQQGSSNLLLCSIF